MKNGLQLKIAITIKLSNGVSLVMLSIRTFLVLVLVLVFFSLSTNAKTSPEQPPLRIAVAANFAPILEKLIPQFNQQSHIPVQIISGSSGTLYLQIKHGAPFDIFLSADSIRPTKLKEDKLITPHSLETYAYGQLALWSAQWTNNEVISLSELTELSKLGKTIKDQRFAIANPKTAPYGKAAKEALKTLKLWPAIQSQLVTGININQTFQQVRSQAVKLGIVANSQLVLNQLTGTIIPSDYHQEIRQQLVILKASKQQENAKKFSEFLLSKNVQQQLLTLGYAKGSKELTKAFAKELSQ